MSNDGSVTHWIQGVKAGDEAAAQALWERYFERLIRLGRKTLRHHPRRVADEEDVVLGAFDSFLKRAKDGGFPKLRDRDNLWPLLVRITACKAKDLIQHDLRDKRGEGKVRGESAFFGSPAADGELGIEQIVGREPTPEFALHVTEQRERLMQALGDETLRGVARMKLEGYTNKEIAREFQTSLRTIERKLWVIRTKWSHQGTVDE